MKPTTRNTKPQSSIGVLGGFNFNPQPSTMPKFECSYAFDIACFADFVVEAKSERAALRHIRKALREGKFENVDASPCWENGATHERVFIVGPAGKFSTTTTLAELINEKPPATP
jgi:hypothetical protein